jgi:hypothetical protein
VQQGCVGLPLPVQLGAGGDLLLFSIHDGGCILRLVQAVSNSEAWRAGYFSLLALQPALQSLQVSAQTLQASCCMQQLHHCASYLTAHGAAS